MNYDKEQKCVVCGEQATCGEPKIHCRECANELLAARQYPIHVGNDHQVRNYDEPQYA